MSRPGPLSERALVLAPHGRDSHVAERILKEARFPAHVCADLDELCEEIERGAGLAIVADEAINTADLRALKTLLGRQPAWSDFPIVLLTHRGGGLERNPAAARVAETLGNVTFLERPFHTTTLTSVVRTAVRSRRRQYDARARLEDLSESEQRLQTALQAGHLGSWTLEVDRMAFLTSASCRAHFGWRDKDVLSYEDFRSAVHPEDRAYVQAAINDALRTGKDCVMEFRNVWPDGTVHWTDVRARALTNPSGQVRCLAGVSSDITERKTNELERERLLRELAVERTALSELTQTLEQRVQERTLALMSEVSAREKAQEQLLHLQKMESLGQLTGGVAHDFNNLLMAVMGNLDLLRKRMADDARAARLIDGALQGAQRGAALTQRMLAFARQQSLETVAADMADLLEGMRTLLEHSVGPQIALRMRLPAGLSPAQVDENQVELAILNLAINARDAMPEGGTIEISLDEKKIEGRNDLGDGSYVRIRVRDNGRGMDPVTLKKAIEPFFSTKPLGKGTGLGLSMVHGLAVQLGGLLELDSAPGKGTTATLWLPATASAPSVATLAGDSPGAVPRTATILVVDDDTLIAMSTVDMLEDLGHTVIEAHSAKRALEILDTGRAVDLMMTDQAMPGMTGIELAKIARHKRPDLPVLLATGYADLAQGQQSTLPRLCKPYRQAQLQAEIDRLLEGEPTRIARAERSGPRFDEAHHEPDQ